MNLTNRRRRTCEPPPGCLTWCGGRSGRQQHGHGRAARPPGTLRLRLCGPIALDHGADAAQEALITIFTQLGQLREPAALFGWARVIAIREAVRVARKARRTAPAELQDVPARDDPELASDVRDVLRRLAPHHRAILGLRDLEGEDLQTVSEMLAVSTETAKSRRRFGDGARLAQLAPG